MSIKSIALIATTLVLSTSVNAAVISTDWQTSGDNFITKDTDSGLEWLDLTVTSGLSYNEVSAELGTGGQYEGWVFASESQLNSLFAAFGAVGPYTGQKASNNQAFDNGLLSTWGINNTQASASQSFFIWDNVPNAGQHDRGRVLDYNYSGYTDAIFITQGGYDDTSTDAWTGSALVRASVVPVPAAVWLFGSGLLGLIGVARRKKA